jgi:hypothetical protein
LKNKTITEKWYYVIVQDPDTSTEQIVGFAEEDTNKKFLPAFKTKQDAERCFMMMPKDIFAGRYDTHAIIEEDLFGAAEKNGHKIYLLDEKGCLLKHLN